MTVMEAISRLRELKRYYDDFVRDGEKHGYRCTEQEIRLEQIKSDLATMEKIDTPDRIEVFYEGYAEGYAAGFKKAIEMGIPKWGADEKV